MGKPEHCQNAKLEESTVRVEVDCFLIILHPHIDDLVCRLDCCGDNISDVGNLASIT